MDDDRPYSERPEWQDITPVKQEDGPQPLATIRYPPGFEEVHDYFRAIQQKNEMSKRAIELTSDVIEHNSANYTAWWYRRLCLKNLNEDLQEELAFTDEWGKNSPKNYQVWYHRRWLIGEISAKLDAAGCQGLAQRELQYLLDVMEDNDDYKNYNGWSHRQFIVSKFGLWSAELPFLEKLLELDIRNNSAWNHRFYTVKSLNWPFTDEVRRRELEFAVNALKKVPHNESAWNYLGGFFGEGEGRAKWDSMPELETACRELAASTEASVGTPCRFAIETLASICVARNDVKGALRYYAQLAEQDKVRANYWKWKADVLSSRVGIQ